LSFPKPELGMVISYEFLWSQEAALGQVHGLKDRPSVIVVSAERQDGNIKVVVAPVTHTRIQPEYSIEIPWRVKESLGLDKEQSWIVATELNEFFWPGFDLKPIKRTKNYVYGYLPPQLFKQLQKKIGICYEESNALRVIKRD